MRSRYYAAPVAFALSLGSVSAARAQDAADDPDAVELTRLRARRFELMLANGLSTSDRLVGHVVPSAAGNYYLTEWLGLGVDAAYYRWFDSGAQLGWPQNEYLWGTGASVSVLPFHSESMPAWDVALRGRVGIVGARPRSVIDPQHRSFDFSPALSFSGGAAMRIFVTSSFAIALEVRDDMVFERMESTQVGPRPDDPSGWLAAEERLTHNLHGQLGLSVWLPSFGPR